MREDTVDHELAELATAVSLADIPNLPKPAVDTPHSLSNIYDAKIEELARGAYGQDYLLFGFEDWS
ncbi:MAG: hypothetical protein HOI22_16175 [Tateyamaria sp.]|nr:hypothetical protein [Tateyamaria sp.]